MYTSFIILWLCLRSLSIEHAKVFFNPDGNESLLRQSFLGNRQLSLGHVKFIINKLYFVAILTWIPWLLRIFNKPILLLFAQQATNIRKGIMDANSLMKICI